MTPGNAVSHAGMPPDEIADITRSLSVAFHCLGDTGGIKDPGPQFARSLRGAQLAPASCHHIGDVVHYNGELRPVPRNLRAADPAYFGNHDGKSSDANATTLQGYHENVLAQGTEDGKPAYTTESRYSGRPALQLPFFSWTLSTPFTTFIGLNGNVPDQCQRDQDKRRVSRQDAGADPHRASIVAVHHPIAARRTWC